MNVYGGECVCCIKRIENMSAQERANSKHFLAHFISKGTGSIYYLDVGGLGSAILGGGGGGYTIHTNPDQLGLVSLYVMLPLTPTPLTSQIILPVGKGVRKPFQNALIKARIKGMGNNWCRRL